MEAYTQAIFRIISKKAKVFTLGQTVENMMENGKSLRCMEKENIHGQMDESMMANIKRI